MTTQTKGRNMEKQINDTNSYDALANLCQTWADDNGIELTGTYAQMARLAPQHAATFRLFAARVKVLLKNKR